MDTGLQSIKFFTQFSYGLKLIRRHSNFHEFMLSYLCMLKRFGLHIALIFLFAFAQIGVVTHEISHLEDFGKHSQQNHSKQDQSTHSEQCDQCISFAKIASGLASQSFTLPILPASFIGSTQASTQALSQPHTAYAARAPPYLS
jgi:hypothetical protein